MKNILLWLCCCMMACSESADTLSVGGGGQGGSMARMTIVGNMLYTVDRQYLNIFDISDAGKPLLLGKVQAGFDIETIFPYKSMLLLGSSRGMYIYSLENPTSPQLLSIFEHIWACDPVVAHNDYAYITLREGTTCRRAVNELQVVDISDPRNPVQRSSFPMKNPKGLGVDGELLFVCDEGLKVFDASEPELVGNRQLQAFSNIDGYDVIPYGGLLMLVGNDGIFQYNYRGESVELLSHIPVQQ